MIVAERKPIEEILKFIASKNKICLLGCRGCVTVCQAGGEKEVGLLASQLTMARRMEGKPIELITRTVERQCDAEFLEAARHEINECEATISMACGIGVQMNAEVFPEKEVYPGVNTRFLGANLKVGVWAERCQSCGQCVLESTGGICPIARCSKSLLNGPCGGSQEGKCEISKDIDCGWALIHERLEKLGQVKRLRDIMPVKDWSHSRDGGPRKLVREELELESGE